MYEAKDFSRLIGMEGFSETALRNHFTLYQGYVTNTNKVRDLLDQMAKDGKIGTPEYAELKRRLGFEWDGMRLHEYYFENLERATSPNRPSSRRRPPPASAATRPGKRTSRGRPLCAASAGPFSIAITRRER
jgi:hypothetical protein